MWYGKIVLIRKNRIEEGIDKAAKQAGKKINKYFDNMDNSERAKR